MLRTPCLLIRAERLAQWDAPDATLISDGMARFARRHGLDPVRGVAINEVMIDGSIRNPAARLWPQTERLKAALARYRRTGEDEERAEAAAAYAGLVQYFETPARGAWRDKLLADGSWIEEPAPGSSMYHITCALRRAHRHGGGRRGGGFHGWSVDRAAERRPAGRDGQSALPELGLAPVYSASTSSRTTSPHVAARLQRGMRRPLLSGFNGFVSPK